MHHTVIGETVFNHNGDYSGDVEIFRNEVAMMVPFRDLKGLVAAYVRDAAIRSLEDQDDDQLLGRGIWP